MEDEDSPYFYVVFRDIGYFNIILLSILWLIRVPRSLFLIYRMGNTVLANSVRLHRSKMGLQMRDGRPHAVRGLICKLHIHFVIFLKIGL
jgi:hypothetical protein